MKVIGKRNFCGTVTMYKGEIRDIDSGPALDDLIACGYVEPAEKKATVKTGENKRDKS